MECLCVGLETATKTGVKGMPLTGMLTDNIVGLFLNCSVLAAGYTAVCATLGWLPIGLHSPAGCCSPS